MNRNEMSFSDDFEFEYCGEFFYAEVEGIRYLDDNNDHTWYTDITKFRILDEDGEVISKNDPDYDDLVEQVMSYEYDPMDMGISTDDDDCDDFI